MSTRTLAVLTAGLGRPSSTRLLADRLAAASTRALADRGVDVQVEVVELRAHAHNLTDRLLTGFPAPALAAAIDTVVRADALITVTPIFSASYSGLFKTFFDVLDPHSLTGKPVLIAATAGSARHSLALEHAVRPLLSYLRAFVVPTAVFAAAEDWASAEGGPSGALADRVERAARELAVLVCSREPGEPTDPAAFTPFTQLLAGG